MLHIFLDHQKKAFEKLKDFAEYLNKNKYLLIGGTSLALQIGHRRSYDFDFITSKKVDTEKLLEEFDKYFLPLKVTQKGKNTLTAVWNNVQFSFFGEITLPLLRKPIRYQHIKLMGIPDIVAMKIAAITKRAALKDYFDLAYVMQFKHVSIKNLFDWFYKKYKRHAIQYSNGFIFNSLSYLNDVHEENIMVLGHPKFWKGKSFKESILKIMTRKKKEFMENG